MEVIQKNKMFLFMTITIIPKEGFYIKKNDHHNPH
jgi:hypothetical protein